MLKQQWWQQRPLLAASLLTLAALFQVHAGQDLQHCIQSTHGLLDTSVRNKLSSSLGEAPHVMGVVDVIGGAASRSLLQYGEWLDVHRLHPCSVNLGCYGRLGNQLLSLFCATHAAHTLRTQLKMTGGGGCYGNLIDEDPLVIPFGKPVDCVEELEVNGWFGRASVDPWDTDVRADFSYVYARMTWPKEDRPESDEMVIYLRAGDIFSERGPDFYLWAPCSFYDRIIEDSRTAANKVTVVTDLSDANGQNPCTKYLQDKYAGMKVQSKSLAEDFGYLVHATHLVLGGVSTFGQLAAFLSPTVQHLYVFSWSQASDSNHILEPIWASMGYFDWPGVTPHHYVVTNYTNRLSQAIDIMTTFEGSNVISMSGAQYWHQYMARGVNTINPWVPFTLTLLVPCESTKGETLHKLKQYHLPWEALPGNNVERSVPSCVFVPHGWQDLLKEFDHPMKYYRAVYTPSLQHPKDQYLTTNDTAYCGNRMPLAYTLQALTSNPFRTTHFLWLSHAAHLERIVKALPQRIKRDQTQMLFFSRAAPEGSRRLEEMTAAVLPASMFSPSRLKHEWVQRADAGMSWIDFLALEKAESPHRYVHWHPGN